MGNGRDSMLQKVIDAGIKQHPHQTEFAAAYSGLVHPVFFFG